MQEAQIENLTLPSDDADNDIRTSMPRILEILLLDRTTSTPMSRIVETSTPLYGKRLMNLCVIMLL